LVIPLRVYPFDTGSGLTTVEHQLKGRLKSHLDTIPFDSTKTSHSSIMSETWKLLTESKSVSLTFDGDGKATAEEMNATRLHDLTEMYKHSGKDAEDTVFDCVLEIEWPESRATRMRKGVPTARL